jgi:predicted enzyme related to lactoylglutathione lyase
MEPTKHTPGTFCWAELMTADGAGAKKFYTGLMNGWSTHDDPLPSGAVYTMVTQDDGNVGAMYEMDAGMKAAGVRPHWMTYVTVENAAATVARVPELGGTVIKDAFDVMDIGSMAVLQDPSGATFSVWQPKVHHGTHFVDGRPGTMCWNELATRDVDKCSTFYGNLFGWKPTPMPMSEVSYTLFTIDGVNKAGMMGMTEEWGDLPSHWMLYLSVADCDATAARATELGGQVCVPPTDIPNVGRFSVITDPQGAVFSAIKLMVPDC